MILKYWNIKFDIELMLKYLQNNKLARYPQSKENENRPWNVPGDQYFPPEHVPLKNLFNIKPNQYKV